MGPQPSESAPLSPEEAEASGPGFFLSYARTAPLRADRADPDYWVKRFFHELAAEIRALDGDLRAGFLTGHVPPGTDPETLTAHQLATCRVFVPLCGDDYFDDEQCGRQWAVFEQRRRLRRARTGAEGESIVPVLWTRRQQRDWPPWVGQVLPGDELYQRLGLFELIRLHENAYREVVRLLAKEIVRRARTQGPPAVAEDALSSAAPAFPLQARSTRRFLITVAAGVRRTVPSERDPEYYGERPEDWRPYQPASPEPIVLRAARIARSLGYRPEITVLTAKSAPTSKSPGAHASPPTCAGILLADPWTLHDKVERRRLELVDRSHRDWIRLMVPWCLTDEETLRQRTSLESAVRDATPWMIQAWRRTCPRDLIDLATAEQFDAALPIVIDRARHHFLNNSGPLQDASVGGYRGRPRLVPPPGDQSMTDRDFKGQGS
jgi:FxsC-like protein